MVIQLEFQIKTIMGNNIPLLKGHLDLLELFLSIFLRVFLLNQ